MALGGAAWRNETRAWRRAMLKTPRPNTGITGVNLSKQFPSRQTTYSGCVGMLGRVMSLIKPTFFGWGFTGRIAMLLPSRAAGWTLALRGLDLARGP